jgi:hypothetical protein
MRPTCTKVMVAAVLLSWPGADSACAQDFPKGTFTSEDPAGGRIMVVTFDGMGKLTVTVGNEELLKSDYKVAKDEVEFSNESGKDGDPTARPGTYNWKLAGNELTFTKVSDDYEGRVKALTQGTWKKKD